MSKHHIEIAARAIISKGIEVAFASDFVLSKTRLENLLGSITREVIAVMEAETDALRLEVFNRQSEANAERQASAAKSDKIVQLEGIIRAHGQTITTLHHRLSIEHNRSEHLKAKLESERSTFISTLAEMHAARLAAQPSAVEHRVATQCSNEMIKQGLPWSPTCAQCNLGPCTHPNHRTT